MKRSHSRPPKNGARQVACTVSAAALMLGVSQAATVGFNFQTHYCGAASYNGAVVTAEAFGIQPSFWESLAQMDTGYGCAASYYTLTQTIDTTTGTGGLNPLPNGSLSLTWSGYTANVSGFGGYSRSGPHYTFGGNGYKPGNEQVYWGFIRDGVNFGPGSNGGDNNQPGYVIDITGLKTVFTNSPFAVQLIGATDSMQTLTNAFIIDATGSTTQSVEYPNTPPVGDSGDTAWVRGVGGGLSTASGAVDTDHLQIIGNRAQHGGHKGVDGFNRSSCIAGFIITDKPVISMPPQPVLVAGGDTVTYSGYAVGVPPLAYQWRKNGQPIANATTSSFSVTNVAAANIGTYDLSVSNAYGVAVSSAVSIGDEVVTAPVSNLIIDSNPSGTERDGVNKGASWVASSSDSVSRTRTGVMSFSSAATNQITVAGGSNFDATNGTYSFWMRSSGVVDNGTGLPVAILDRRAGNGDGFVVGQLGDGTLQVLVGPTLTPVNAVATTASVSDNKWHLIAVTYDVGDAGGLSIYVDGALIANSPNGGVAWSWHPGQEIELGTSHDAADYQPYNGSLDDVRFYSRILTGTEITSIHNTDALVDTSTLGLQLNFTAAPASGLSLTWKVTDAVLQSADSVSGPYTDLIGATSPYLVAPVKTAKFYRYHGHNAVAIVANPYLM